MMVIMVSISFLASVEHSTTSYKRGKKDGLPLHGEVKKDFSAPLKGKAEEIIIFFPKLGLPLIA